MALFNWNTSPIDPEFDKLWSQVEEFQKQGKPRAASAVIDDIIELASKKDARPHQVKAYQYKANFIEQLEENGALKAMDYLENLLSSNLTEEVEALVEMSLAENMQFYVQNQFYRLNNRTDVSGELPKDKAAWSVKHFEAASRRHLLNALGAKNKLLDIDIKIYENVINPGENTLHLTPTLYDFIADEALKYFTSDQKYAIEAIETEPINWQQQLVGFDDFIKIESKIQDDESFDQYAINLYQDLLAAQIKRSNKDGFIHTELGRLNYIKSKLNGEEADDVYEQLLTRLLSTYGKHAESTLINQTLAQYYMQKAGDEADKESAGQWRIKAHSLLEKAIAEHKESYGAQQCQLTLNSLETPQLDIQMEKAIPTNTSSLLYITHKGLRGVHVRIGKMTTEDFIQYQSDYRIRQNIKSVFNRTDIKVDRVLSLTDNKNYTNYSTEHMLDGLSSGIYLVYAENEKANITSYQIIHCSNLAYAHTSDGHSNTDLIVFNRVSGNPQSDVQVNLYNLDRGRSGLTMIKESTAFTDLNGILTLEAVNQRSVMIELIQGEDRFLPYENVYINRPYGEPVSRPEATILTDRAIYRPGQDVHFKIIMYQKDAKNIPTLLTDTKAQVELVNPNGKVESTQELRTNSYGSVSGIFKAPNHGLKGQFYIRVNGLANHQIQIEEYKRPKFNVVMEIPDGELMGGQTIAVPGLAKSFSGVALENAKVNYKVVRSKEFRYYWWSNYRYGGRDQGEKLVAVGESTTDQDGKFEIPFESILEKDDQKYWRPIYVYKITADITDENGETRTGEIAIRIGSEPYYIKTTIGQQVKTEDFESFTMSSENAMGKPAKSDVTAKIFSLIAPKSPKVDRLWQLPDYAVTDKKAFESEFAQLNYQSTTDYNEWQTGQEVFSQSMALDGDKLITLNKSLKPGVYKTIVMDAKGDEKYTTYFVVYSFEQSTLPSKDQLVMQTDETSYQPGEVVQLMLESPFNRTKAFVQIEKDKRIISQQWYTLDNNQIIKIPVTENDRGGFIVRTIHVVHNRTVSKQLNIQVPWNNKKLDITWETFRDKLLPGQEESWRLKISGPDKELVMAEVLASMYDASLDEFVPHQWRMDLFPSYYSRGHLSFGGFGIVHGNILYDGQPPFKQGIQRAFPTWRYLGRGRYAQRMYKTSQMMRSQAAPGHEMEMNEELAEPQMDADAAGMDNISAEMHTASGEIESTTKKDFAPRRNLNETVFFMPHLMTDKAGNVIIEFTMNEALTSWKLQLLAHTTDLKSGLNTREVVTQKDFMVFPQIPRFVREGDAVIISAKINKLIAKDLSGTAWIEITDALNGDKLTSMLVKNENQGFALMDENQTAVNWTVNIPKGFIRPIEITVRARSGKHTDGEVNTIPVITNQILVTETLPMLVRAKQTKNYTFEALKNMNEKDVRPYKLTLEFMENPVWFAVQSMPYLTDYPHQCTEQIAHKIYANSIASHIIKQYPKIQEIFKEWDNKDELISSLNKNQELKSALIEETPWLREAESEEEQMKNIALLFDYDRMAGELDKNIDILLSRQLSDGGFVWFSGGLANTYITQLVVEIFGHLQALNIEIPRQNEWKPAVTRAIQYSHNEMKERYDRIINKNKENNYLDATSLHAIYITSFFIENAGNLDFPAWNYYYSQARTKWVTRTMYEQAILATAFYRFDEINLTNDIVASFKDKALRSEELGMYWKNESGYYWHNQPIETHAHMMEAIALVDENADDMNEMRIWLLKNKQTNRWRSTVSTAKAIYALLLRGEDWMGTTKPLFVKIGSQIVSTPDGINPAETQAGTGYFKKSWDANEITSNMADLKVENKNDIVSWGAAYWQYFQAIDQVKKHDDNPLKVKRAIFKKVRSTSGESLVAVTEENISVGDKITVRLEISVDRMMEFIHLKDLRAAGFEPIDVLSGYRWTGGMSYYQSTTDLGTHFFIDFIQVGTYVIEYDAFATNAGDFSGGMSTLQCMYAPEFASHSEGSRVTIKR
jgi:uncharacterized protein YfaS (alpha-2-macroglobulin family)